MAIPSLAAREHGRGPAVVLLHGQPGERGDWDAVVARLDEGLRVIVPDRPGYGSTGGSAVGVAANSDAVVALLDRLGVGSAVVVGHSWAGAVALDLAQRYPSRSSALVLVASVGGEPTLGVLDRILCWPVLGPALSIAGLGILRPHRLRRLLARVLVPEVVSGGREAIQAPGVGSWRSFVLEQRALVSELPLVVAGLGRVSVPVTVVVGAADRLVAPASQEALAAALPRAQVVRVGGAGHLLPQQAPAVVAAAITRAAGLSPR